MDKEIQKRTRNIFRGFGEFIKGNVSELDFDGALKALLSTLPPPKDRSPWGVIVNELEGALFRAKIEDILTRYGEFMDGDDSSGLDIKGLLDIDEALAEIERVCRKLKDKPPLLSDGDIADVYYKSEMSFASDDLFRLSKAIAQAQREADIKYYTG